MKLDDQDKAWTPHIVYKTCTEYLRPWTNAKKSCLKVGIPIVWREPENHGTACYFCVNNLIIRKNRSSLTYPDIQSARRPVAHCDEIPVHVFGELFDMSDEDSSGVEENEEEVVLDDDAQHPFSQMELNDLVRDLGLSKSPAELLTSRLMEKNSPWNSARITLYHNRHVSPFFSMKSRIWCTVRYYTVSAQAWSVTVPTRRLETVHREQQTITEMCSAAQRKPVCLCSPRPLDYAERKV